ncbi:helix-turn-helix domain-containing protein [Marinobacter sp.]|uniref:helix-turn-helix domain-containing protein n=1 Tax=Marinobacter sp. TaxID=50741 RepID=UPI003A8CF0FC
MEGHTSPRILYLWPRRTVHVGQVKGIGEFSQAAASLMVSLEGPVKVMSAGMRVPTECSSLLLRAGQTVTIDAGEAVLGTCYLDALGQDYDMLLPCMAECREGILCSVDGEAAYRDFFSQLLTETARTPEQAYQVLEQLINPRRRPYPEVDARVAATVAMIQARVAENTAVEDLAAAVSLSVPRLVQLFREQVGVPIRRYRLWHRLFVTAEGVGRGLSLTDAAITAGFNDSAHFCHSFRLILGLKPSYIFPALRDTRVCVSSMSNIAPAGSGL